MKLITAVDGEWERIIGDDGQVILEGHRLTAEDVLFALGYRFEIEEVDIDDF